METIDVDYAESLGIRCLNSPEGNRDAVGEHAVGLLLALADKIAAADKEVRQGLWRREANRGFEIKGRTVGIIGFGNMGQAFARRLGGFGCRVIYYDKYLISPIDPISPISPIGSLSPIRVNLEQLQAEADVVSFHVPLTDETRHYLSPAFIDAMAKPFFLLNTSRGAVVDTEALADALRNSGTACEAGETKSCADRCRRDWQCKGNSDDEGDEHSHEERLQLCSPHDEITDVHSCCSKGRCPPCGQGNTDSDGDERCDQNIDPGLLGDHFSDFRGDDRDEEDRQRAARTAERVRGEPDRDQRK
jgi:hypothetical protein